jgi:cytochrome b561
MQQSAATMANRDDLPVRRYSNTAVTIHWITVVLVLLQIWLGLSFADMAQGPERGNLFTWHKTVGTLILLLTIGRLTYRLSNPPPALPHDLPNWERIAAVWNHRLFYVLLIGLPIGGLVAVSGHANGAATTPMLGGVPLPLIPGITKDMGEVAGNMHSLLAWGLIALIVVHLAAALKHQFVDRSPSAGRMPPFRPPHDEPVVVGQGSDAGER